MIAAHPQAIGRPVFGRSDRSEHRTNGAAQPAAAAAAPRENAGIAPRGSEAVAPPAKTAAIRTHAPRPRKTIVGQSMSHKLQGSPASSARVERESRDLKRRVRRMVCVRQRGECLQPPVASRALAALCRGSCRASLLVAAGALVVASVGSPASPSGRVIRVASLGVSLPAGWTWAQERGGYRNCSNPVVKLWAASHRLPKGFGRHEGPLVVPRGQVLVVLAAAPIRSSSTLWKRWRVSNAKLRPAVPADGSRYKAQLTFPSTPAVGATLWAGSHRLSARMLRATNRLLASLSVDPAYGCR
jgi:hypothetical protein